MLVTWWDEEPYEIATGARLYLRGQRRGALAKEEEKETRRESRTKIKLSDCDVSDSSFEGWSYYLEEGQGQRTIVLRRVEFINWPWVETKNIITELRANYLCNWAAINFINFIN